MRAWSGALGVLLVCTACAPPERPDTASWRAVWDEMLDLVADEPAGDEEELAEWCHALLVGTREAHADLLPTPDHALDLLAQEWLSEAEGLGFQCPARRGDLEQHEAALRELRILEAEIDAGLAALLAE